MGAILASVSGRATVFLGSTLLALTSYLGLPDLDRIRDILKRVQEILALGGVALATAASFVFVFAWVLTHLRRPKAKGSPKFLPVAALWSSYAPVVFTVAAAAATFIPLLQPFILKCFALAVVTAALSWAISVAAVVIGGCRQDLQRARRALLLAGTPWYCLALYLARYL